MGDSITERESCLQGIGDCEYLCMVYYHLSETTGLTSDRETKLGYNLVNCS